MLYDLVSIFYMMKTMVADNADLITPTIFDDTVQVPGTVFWSRHPEHNLKYSLNMFL